MADAELQIEVSGIERMIAETKQARAEAQGLREDFKKAVAGEVLIASVNTLAGAFDGASAAGLKAAASLGQAWLQGGPVGLGIASVSLLLAEGVKAWNAYEEQAAIAGQETERHLRLSAEATARIRDQVAEAQDRLAAVRQAATAGGSVEEALGVLSGERVARSIEDHRRMIEAYRRNLRALSSEFVAGERAENATRQTQQLVRAIETSEAEIARLEAEGERQRTEAQAKAEEAALAARRARAVEEQRERAEALRRMEAIEQDSARRRAEAWRAEAEEQRRREAAVAESRLEAEQDAFLREQRAQAEREQIASEEELAARVARESAAREAEQRVRDEAAAVAQKRRQQAEAQAAEDSKTTRRRLDALTSVVERTADAYARYGVAVAASADSTDALQTSVRDASAAALDAVVGAIAREAEIKAAKEAVEAVASAASLDAVGAVGHAAAAAGFAALAGAIGGAGSGLVDLVKGSSATSQQAASPRSTVSAGPSREAERGPVTVVLSSQGVLMTTADVSRAIRQGVAAAEARR